MNQDMQERIDLLLDALRKRLKDPAIDRVDISVTNDIVEGTKDYINREIAPTGGFTVTITAYPSREAEWKARQAVKPDLMWRMGLSHFDEEE